MHQAAARVDDIRYIAIALFRIRCDQRLRQAADDLGRVVKIEQEGADAVLAHRPTPWLMTSQPASVSIGEPQLPNWMNSQGNRGSRMSCMLSRNADDRKTSRRCFRRPAAKHRIETIDFARERAMPLFSTAGPFSVMN